MSWAQKCILHTDLQLQDSEVRLYWAHLPALILKEDPQLLQAVTVIVAEVVAALLLDGVLQIFRLTAAELLANLNQSTSPRTVQPSRSSAHKYLRPLPFF
jgi:hypothetical protein